jgi:hypothetical protein
MFNQEKISKLKMMSKLQSFRLVANPTLSHEEIGFMEKFHFLMNYCCFFFINIFNSMCGGKNIVTSATVFLFSL